jgi:hypothetical protein
MAAAPHHGDDFGVGKGQVRSRLNPLGSSLYDEFTRRCVKWFTKQAPDPFWQTSGSY